MPKYCCNCLFSCCCKPTSNIAQQTNNQNEENNFDELLSKFLCSIVYIYHFLGIFCRPQPN